MWNLCFSVSVFSKKTWCYFFLRECKWIKKLLKRILYLQNTRSVHSKMSESETLDAIAEIVSPSIFIITNAQGSTTYNFERVDSFFIILIYSWRNYLKDIPPPLMSLPSEALSFLRQRFQNLVIFHYYWLLYWRHRFRYFFDPIHFKK